ncbi:MAG: hypothetical protein KC561_14285, partial [Myxococcales bacterium]|nr:hypothetical protein [Myxococcales bacterium]
TLDAIFAEKVQILRDGRPAVVMNPVGWDSSRTEEAIRTSGIDPSPLLLEDRDFGVEDQEIWIGTTRLAKNWVPFLGSHQLRNAACALTAATTWLGAPSSEQVQEIARSMSRARWPGRMSRVQFDGSEVLVDGAHNLDGAQAAAAWLGETFPDGVSLVFGAMADKPVARMLSILSDRAKRIWLVEVNNPRLCGQTELEAHAHTAGLTRAELGRSLRGALEEALAGESQVVVVGSLYLVGEVYSLAGLDAEAIRVIES